MEDVIEGRWCIPRNVHRHIEGTIHHDATARRLGYAEGLVAGSVHLEQFAPMLIRYFGDDWWRRGLISVSFVSTTVDHEPVCCYLEPDGPERALVWMNVEGEALILRGTASLGPDARSEVAQCLRDQPSPARLHLLADVQVGATCRPLPVRVAPTQVDERLAVITEPMSCYRHPTPFGARVAPMGAVVDAMRWVEPELAPATGTCVTVEGALEVQFQNGPVLCDHDYLVEGRVLALSEGADAEELWYQVDLQEAADRRPVARMIRLARLLRNTCRA